MLSGGSCVGSGGDADADDGVIGEDTAGGRGDSTSTVAPKVYCCNCIRAKEESVSHGVHTRRSEKRSRVVGVELKVVQSRENVK